MAQVEIGLVDTLTAEQAGYKQSLGRRQVQMAVAAGEMQDARREVPACSSAVTTTPVRLAPLAPAQGPRSPDYRAWTEIGCAPAGG